MLLGLSFRLVLIFIVISWILSGFPLSSFHLAKANLVPRAILKKLKTWRQKFKKLKPHYLLFCGFTFLCMQLSKIFTKCCLKKIFFLLEILMLILQSTCFCITWKRKQTIEQQLHSACGEWTKSNKNKNK